MQITFDTFSQLSDSAASSRLCYVAERAIGIDRNSGTRMESATRTRGRRQLSLCGGFVKIAGGTSINTDW